MFSFQTLKTSNMRNVNVFCLLNHHVKCKFTCWLSGWGGWLQNHKLFIDLILNIFRTNLEIFIFYSGWIVKTIFRAPSRQNFIFGYFLNNESFCTYFKTLRSASCICSLLFSAKLRWTSSRVPISPVDCPICISFFLLFNCQWWVWRTLSITPLMYFAFKEK